MAGTVLKLGHVVATTTVVNTVTETNLMSVAVPSGSLDTVGRTVRIEAAGDILNNSGAAATIIFKFKFGTTTILTTKAISLGTDANRRSWRVDLDLIAETSSAQRASGLLHISEASADTWRTDEASGINATAGPGTATETTATEKNVIISATLGTAHASFEITIKMATVELLR